MRVKIFVSLKNGVLDPQGKAIERSLHSLGYNESTMSAWASISSSKWTRLRATPPRLEFAKCVINYSRIPVIEDYRFEIRLSTE